MYERRKYRARHILVEDIDDAEYILERLSSTHKFEDLAREFSECDSLHNGGDLGVFYSGQMDGVFEKAVHNLEEFEISKPIKTKHGFHIIQRLPVKL